MKNLQLLFLGLFICFGIMSCQQKADPSIPPQNVERDLNRFEASIKGFETQDKNRTPNADEILFIGSSSIRMWSSLAEDMSPMRVINRGFGGSTLPEVIHYADRIIFPYSPQLIVLYCGENDISEGETPQMVFRSFKQLVHLIESRLPNADIVYLPMKPSVNRWNLWPQYQEGNALISDYINIPTQTHLFEIPIEKSMLEASGEVKTDIFIEDNLHMNAKGYEGWTEMVRPFLMDLFKGELLDMDEQAAFQKLVELVRTDDAPDSLVAKTALLEQTYQFWMADKTDVTEAQPIQQRLARVAPGILLNRFSTDTTNTVPVGLNALLHGLETKLAKCYELKKADVQRKTYQSLADFRQAAILKFCWNEKEGRFSDYNFVEKNNTTQWQLSNMLPLYAGLASPEQAKKTKEYFKIMMKKDNVRNGYARNDTLLMPLVVEGLENYGLEITTWGILEE